MTREQIRQGINRLDLTQIINITPSPDRAKNKYCCPICGSGNGKNRSGALTFYPGTNRWVCFACPDSPDTFGGKGQDTLGALRILWDCTEAQVFDRLGYTMPQNAPDSPIMPQTAPRREIITMAEQTPQRAAESDYTAYYAKCAAQLAGSKEAIAYLAIRGISYKTAAKCGVGFDPAADPAGAGHKAPRIIIPTSQSHYVARAIDPNTPDKYKKINNKGGTAAIFNAERLTANEPVFVCEGAFDAMAVEEAGAAAIALNSTSNVQKLVSLLQTMQSIPPLVVCLDNDKAGRDGTQQIKNAIDQLGGVYQIANISGNAKDPNEALTVNREQFIQTVRKQLWVINTKKPHSDKGFINHMMAAQIAEFKRNSDRLTGFNNLDAQIGGLHPGLYVVAAISSLGKTTFSHQIATQLAEQGHEVLFFSLEQSTLEMITKAIARTAAQTDIDTAVSSLAIRKGYTSNAITQAAQKYIDAVGDNISTIEAEFNCNAKWICDEVQNHINRTNTKPVVFIDYLQVIEPDPATQAKTQREATDSVIKQFKQLSKDLGLIVFVISSVNRANYLSTISFEALKESGCIEYTADVIWGLQLKILNDPQFVQEKSIENKRKMINAAKGQDVREIELVCLKNRFGRSTFDGICFDYHPRVDWFEEQAEPQKINVVSKRGKTDGRI